MSDCKNKAENAELKAEIAQYKKVFDSAAPLDESPTVLALKAEVEELRGELVQLASPFQQDVMDDLGDCEFCGGRAHCRDLSWEIKHESDCPTMKARRVFDKYKEEKETTDE